MCVFDLFLQVALHFVKDEKTRFSLALECGNIEVGRESRWTPVHRKDRLLCMGISPGFFPLVDHVT